MHACNHANHVFVIPRLSVPAESAVQPSNKTLHAVDRPAGGHLHRAPFDLSTAALCLSHRATLLLYRTEADFMLSPLSVYAASSALLH